MPAAGWYSCHIMECLVIYNIIPVQRDAKLESHFQYLYHGGCSTAHLSSSHWVTLLGEVNLHTDYDWFFRPTDNKANIAPIFQKSHIYQTFFDYPSVRGHCSAADAVFQADKQTFMEICSWYRSKTCFHSSERRSQHYKRRWEGRWEKRPRPLCRLEACTIIPLTQECNTHAPLCVLYVHPHRAARVAIDSILFD